MKIKLVIVSVIAMFTGLFPSCIKEGIKPCELYLNLSFYSQTQCQNNREYPEEIDNLLICIFDEYDLLAYVRAVDNVKISRDYTEQFRLAKAGLYYAIVWTGIDDEIFNIAELKVGETSGSDLLFRLNRTQQQAAPTQGTVVYFGSSPKTEVSGNSSRPVKTDVNLIEVTNRLAIIVEGLWPETGNYEINIASDDGSMTVDGRIAADETINYNGVIRSNDDLLIADFTLLKLESDHTNTLSIRNREENVELYSNNLLEELVMKNPDIDLKCHHDFEIRFRGEEIGGTFMITEVWINDWQIHSYEWEN